MNPSQSSQNINLQTGSSRVVHTLTGLYVLLAEDCADQGRLYLKFLQQAGAEVTLECNGQSAVNVVTNSPNLFNAVVMDFQMPKIGGLDATKQLREIGYRGAIIAITAYGSEHLKQSWFEAGCDEFLEKPLNKQELISAVVRHTIATKEAVS